VDFASQQILLANIVELRGLLEELGNPLTGRNPVTAGVILVDIQTKIERLKNEQLHSESDNSGTPTDSE